MSENDYDVIVIGAGPNGLSCGAYLAKAGAKTLVLEKKWETGGGLATEDFNSPFRFNLHAIYMMLADYAPLHRDLELEKHNLAYIWPEVQVAFHHKDGRALVFYRDPEKSVASVGRFNASDAERFRTMYTDFKEVCDEILLPATYAPPVPVFEKLVLMQQTEVGRKLEQLGQMTPEEIIDSYDFEDPRVKAALLYMATVWGIRPDSANIGYLVPIWIYRMMSSALVRGGTHTLSSAIHNALKKAGGVVHEWAGVKNILIENGRAVGVICEDGRQYRARKVVSTLNPEQTFIECIGRGNQPDELYDVASKWQWEDISLFTAHYGIKGAPPHYRSTAFNPDVDGALIHVIGMEKPEDVHHAQADVLAGRLGGVHGHATCPSYFDRHQVCESDLHGPLNTLRFECWAPYDLDAGDWDTIKHEYSKRCLEAWTEYAPNLENAKVLFEMAYSPLDIERRLASMKRGSFKHGAYNMFQMGYLRPNDRCSQYHTPIDGLYLGGASVYPGGMVLFGSGYNCARAVAEDLDLNIWWSEPECVTRAKENGYLPTET